MKYAICSCRLTQELYQTYRLTHNVYVPQTPLGQAACYGVCFIPAYDVIEARRRIPEKYSLQIWYNELTRHIRTATFEELLVWQQTIIDEYTQTATPTSPEAVDYFNRGDEVIFTQGIFANMTGVVQRVKPSAVRVHIQSHFFKRVEVPKNWIRRTFPDKS